MRAHPTDKVEGCLSVGHHKVVIETIVRSAGAFGQHIPESEIAFIVSVNCTIVGIFISKTFLPS